MQRRHRNKLCLEVGQGLAKADEILRVRRDCEVKVAAKLGPAIQHARLAAHEEGADAVLLD
jgi:hypothetical protein